MPAWKRQLYFLHRWLGIVLCAFFALWFFSGIFMMYVEFPSLTRAERLESAAALDFSSASLLPGDAVRALEPGDFETVGAPHANRRIAATEPDVPITADDVRLGMLFDEPVYRIYPDNGAQPRTVSAATGEVFERFGEEGALVAAKEFAHARGLDPAAATYLGLIQTDQWTVSSAMNGHRPLHHVSLGDAVGTEVYISSTTGEVVRDSHRRERRLNYLAAVTHWLYPIFIRRHAEFWRYMVEILSGAGAVLGITGLWIGILRLRRRRKASMSIIPYRGVMRWHHITGLAFGIVAITWVFSGLLSMNPGDLNPSRSPTAAEQQVYSGKGLTPDDFVAPIAVPPGIDVVAAKLMHYDGFPYYLATTRDGDERLLPGATGAPPSPSSGVIIDRARLLMPDAPLRDAAVLRDYDDYWYASEPGRSGPTLPIVRVRFADPRETWFYIDPRTGQVLRRMTDTNRLYRWLYNGLHSWDFRWLLERRPLWDIAVIGFSLGGLTLSIIGMVVAWRRLRFEKHLLTVKRRRKSEAQGPQKSAA